MIAKVLIKSIPKDIQSHLQAYENELDNIYDTLEDGEKLRFGFSCSLHTNSEGLYEIETKISINQKKFKDKMIRYVNPSQMELIFGEQQ